MKAKCFMCNEKTAKVMPKVQDRAGSYKNEAFCSMTCAARWALIYMKDEMHEWCEKCKKWFSSAQYMNGCPDCKKKEEE